MGKVITRDNDSFNQLSVSYFSGTGSPEGSKTASVGDIFARTDGSTGTTLYIKESGNSSNTGWVAVSSSGGTGVSKFDADVTLNGSETVKNVDVSSDITDARTAIWQFIDKNNSYERIYCTIKVTSASNIRIETGTPLPASTYRLIGIE